MESQKFDLVFNGQLLPRQELATVKSNMAALFKISSAQVNALFSGKPVVLKRSVDLTAANRYRVAIKKAGARVELVKAGAEPTRPAAAASSHPQSRPEMAQDTEAVAPSTSAPTSAPTAAAESTAPSSSVAQAPQSAPDEQALSSAISVLPLGEGLPNPSEPLAQESVAIPSFDVLAAGSDLLADTEKAHVNPLDIDLSALSVRELGELMDAEEKYAAEPVDVADLGAEVLPAGTQLITESERVPKVPRHINDLIVDIAPVGARLEAEKPAAPAPPNVEHIQLAD